MPRRAAAISRASRWCSIQGRQSRERGLDSSFRPIFATLADGAVCAPYSGSSGSRRALRRALVAAAEVDGADKAPADRGRLPRILPDHDLRGAARAVIAGQEHAVLEVDLVVERLEGPDVAVGQHQHDAAGVGQAARLHRRMQMKAQRKVGLVALDARARRAATACPRRRAARRLGAIISTRRCTTPNAADSRHARWSADRRSRTVSR